jgi:hypothetical protein
MLFYRNLIIFLKMSNFLHAWITSDWIAAISFVSGIGGFVMGVVFFVLGVKQQQAASKIHTETQFELYKTLNEIKSYILGINHSQQKMNDKILNAFFQQHSTLLQNKITNKISDENFLDKLENNELTKTIEDSKTETTREISEFYNILSLLSRNEIGVLYAIWLSRTIDINKIKRNTNYDPQQIRQAILSLQEHNIIEADGKIGFSFNLLLEEIFNLDYYGGMSFTAKINSIQELIDQAKKVNG